MADICDHPYVQEQDEFTLIPCDPCKYANNASDSIGYCVERNEYICDQCTQFHKKFQITRSHNIVKGEKVLRTKEERAEEALLPMMFCDDHKQAFCGLCKATKHHSCLQCSKLEDIAKPEDSEKIEGAIEKLEIDMDDFRKSNNEKNVELDKVRRSMVTCKQHIANSKATLITLFKQLEKDLDTVELEVEAECQSEVSFMALLKATKLSDECKILRSTLVSKERRPLFTIQVQENQDFSNVLTNISGLGAIVKRTFSYETSEPQSDQVSGIVKKETVDTNHDNDVKLANDIHSDTRSIVKEEVITRAEGTSQHVEGREDKDNCYATKGKVHMTSSGDISTKKCIAPSSGNTGSVSSQIAVDLGFIQESFQGTSTEKVDADKSNLRNMKIEHMTKWSVKSTIYFKNCDITGLTVLQNGYIVLCDLSNRNVKLLRPDFTVSLVCHTEGKPWDVAARNTTEVVVTLTTNRVLQFLSIFNDFPLGKKINTKMPNWGIDIFDDHLFITQHNNPGNGRVEIRKMDGHIVRQLVFKDWFASDFIKVPSYITVHNDSKNIRMCVTDGQEKTIVCLNPEDRNIRHVRNLGFNWPKGLLTDGEGNCLVCIRFGNKLKLVNYSSFEVSPTNGSVSKNVVWGGKCDVWANGCLTPQAIGMRWDDHTLFVGTANSDELFVAKLKCVR